jgi:hypothetical protein
MTANLFQCCFAGGGPPPALLAPAQAPGASRGLRLYPFGGAPRARDPGARLPEALRHCFQEVYGRSFEEVRYHVSPLPPALQAKAMASGSRIFFAPGQFDPASARGIRLLGHELGHIVQQRRRHAGSPAAGDFLWYEPQLEAEADRLSLRLGAAWERASRKSVAVAQAKKAPAPAALSRGVVQPFVTIGRERIATRARDLPHSRSLRNPAVVVPGTQIFTSQVRQGQQGFLNRAQTDVNLSRLSVNLSLRISGDHRMAIEDSNLVNRQPKCFFAAAAVINEANQELQNAGSPVRLQTGGETIDVYSGPATYHRLSKVLPRRADNTQVGLALRAAQNCNDIGGWLCGRRSADTGLVTDTGTRIGFAQEASIFNEVQYAIGQFLAERLGGSSGDHRAAIAAIPAVSDDPIGDRRRGDQLRNRIARDYVTVLRGQNRDRVREELEALGINELATVDVGEAYVISSLAAPEDRAQQRVRDIASNRLFQASWSYHFGGVVARSGGDVITLENYARGSDEPVGPNPGADPRWYFQMYSQRNRGQTFHEFHSATRGYANPMTLALRRDADPDVLPLAPRRPAPPARRRPNPPRRLGRRHAIGGAAAVVLSVLLYQVIRSVLGSAA